MWSPSSEQIAEYLLTQVPTSSSIAAVPFCSSIGMLSAYGISVVFPAPFHTIPAPKINVSIYADQEQLLPSKLGPGHQQNSHLHVACHVLPKSTNPVFQ
ncbi:hypothetical protein Nepgr_001869 [Nepenthes gracilis]|uniref:Uncharacterized protein n=1 Tax=Nepenthes gracilis TaxID=150966 RepID=A0AAD3P353_NEPGR|nr:hypothetical protein Nepgr_001869 [Nepenthes gracilis]